MTKLEQIKDLPYVDVKEHIGDLDKPQELLYVDYSQLENNEQQADVFTKAVSLGSLSVPKDYDIRELIQQLFFNRLVYIFSYNNNQTINVKESDKIDIINTTIDKYLQNLKNPKDTREYKSFAFVPKNYDKELNVDSVIESEGLDNEIIFGYKTGVDMPGIVVITNEEGLSDNENIRIAVVDLGFFPEKSYYRIKINNYNV